MVLIDNGKQVHSVTVNGKCRHKTIANLTKMKLSQASIQLLKTFL